MLDLNTFSKTPAGHYLVRRLNEINDKKLTRACTVRINVANANLADLYCSVQNECMTAKTAANLLRLLREEATTIELDAGLPDSKFISQLLRNVIIGKIKSMMRKVEVIRKIENGTVDEPTVIRKGSLFSPIHTDAYAPRHYHILGYEAAMVLPTEDPSRRFWNKTPNISCINDTTTPEVLHERSTARCIRQGKQFLNDTTQGECK